LRDEVALVSVRGPLRLDAYNEPEPDVMLLRSRPDGYRAAHSGAADVLLLVEVSESSLSYDRSVELALYAKFGVPEVWIIDLVGGAVEVYRGPRDGAYAARERLTGGLLAPALVPGVMIDVAGSSRSLRGRPPSPRSGEGGAERRMGCGRRNPSMKISR
jgi:Uma2 family endonuclease